MRKVILYVAASLDGYIARTTGAVDWLDPEAGDYGYDEFIAGIDTVIMGRTTYEQALSFGEWYYGDKECFVYSSKDLSDTELVKFTNKNPAELIAELRNQPGKDIWLIGGAELIQEFMKHDLIDEYQIFIQPTLIGSGIPLFKPHTREQTLELVRNRSFSSGMVELHLRRSASEQS